MTGAIGNWEALELEKAGAEAGIVMPLVLSLPEFLQEQQYREVLADPTQRPAIIHTWLSVRF